MLWLIIAVCAIHWNQAFCGFACVCSIGSGPVEHLELVHVSGWFWSVSSLRRDEGTGPARTSVFLYFVKSAFRFGTAVVILDQEKVTRRTACTVQSSASWQSRPTSSST